MPSPSLDSPSTVHIRRSVSVAEIHHSLAPYAKKHSKAYSERSTKSYGQQTRSTSTEVLDRHRWSMPSHRKQCDIENWDEYWWDRRTYMKPLAWPNVKTPSRRYNYIDPPISLWPYMPGTWHPHYSSGLADQSHMDGAYWHRYKDPSYQLPWVKPWRYEMTDVKLALKMHKQKLMDFSEVDKFWLRPSFYRRRRWDAAHLPASDR